jgi:hypothetical protein
MPDKPPVESLTVGNGGNEAHIEGEADNRAYWQDVAVYSHPDGGVVLYFSITKLRTDRISVRHTKAEAIHLSAEAWAHLKAIG